MTALHLQIAFITGRSRPDNLALSPAQSSFSEHLAHDGVRLIPINFPWKPQATHFIPTGLLRASVNNSREYLASRYPAFAARYRQAAMTLLASADHTLLLSGSCGLELFNNLQLPSALMSRVSLFAYGPVARRRPDCHHMLVQGSRDWISRLWFRGEKVALNCGHMDYLASSELMALCLKFIDEIKQRKQ